MTAIYLHYVEPIVSAMSGWLRISRNADAGRIIVD
jgi:hypothetical protein